MFELHPRLREDTFRIGKFPLSIVLLMNDANTPWCILVPERDGISEIHDLSPEDQTQLMRETVGLSEALARSFGADKINIGALGNLVPQLHVHVVVRFRNDAAWPGPVWGNAPARPYGEREAEAMKERIKELFAGTLLLP